MQNGQIKSSGRKTAYLNFDRITRTDDGMYTCTANNTAGTKTHIETLLVRCESEIFPFVIDQHCTANLLNTFFNMPFFLHIRYKKDQ